MPPWQPLIMIYAKCKSLCYYFNIWYDHLQRGMDAYIIFTVDGHHLLVFTHDLKGCYLLMAELHIDPKKTALVVIDIQKGIVGLPTVPNDKDEVIKNCVTLADAFRDAGGFVSLVHVDFHDGKDALQPATDQEARQGGKRPEGFTDILPELGPKDNDLVITKHQWGAFYGTELDLQLRRRGIDTIVLCGIATGIGVDTTAREAFQRNYNQVFAIDAMNALSEQEHDYTVNTIFPRMGKVRNTQDIINALKK